MELIIVRHGRPERVEGVANGADPALTDIGLRQAEEMATWLSSEPIDALYVSPMLRARQTSAPLERELGLRASVVPGVREFDAAESAYIPMEELKQDREAWRAWLASERETPRDQFHETVRTAIGQIVADHRGQRIVVVCHGGVINSIAADVLGLTDSLFFGPDYSSINRFQYSSAGHKSIVSLNDIGHLRRFPELQLS